MIERSNFSVSRHCRWPWFRWGFVCEEGSCRDDKSIKFWQRNRPGDREEVLFSNMSTFRSCNDCLNEA